VTRIVASDCSENRTLVVTGAMFPSLTIIPNGILVTSAGARRKTSRRVLFSCQAGSRSSMAILYMVHHEKKRFWSPCDSGDTAPHRTLVTKTRQLRSIRSGERRDWYFTESKTNYTSCKRAYLHAKSGTRNRAREKRRTKTEM
jgi:hypothetical protein